VQAIEEHNNRLATNADHYKFRCSINDDQYEEILSYNKILSFIKQQDVGPSSGSSNALLPMKVPYG